MEYEEENLHNDEAAINKGQRAEEIAEWYFRLNGFFLIPGFVVHPDAPRPTPRTEADLLGVRLKGSTEGVWHQKSSHSERQKNNKFFSMDDDRIFINAARVGTVARHLVAMVEVKAGRCKINGPWSDRNIKDSQPGMSNMARALGRVGFGTRDETIRASDLMYQNLRYEGTEFVVQYFAVGKLESQNLKDTYPLLIQITFDHIGEFLHSRFSKFPEKIPIDRNIQIWRGFGGWFRNWWFESENYRRTPTVTSCQQAVSAYIEKGL